MLPRLRVALLLCVLLAGPRAFAPDTETQRFFDGGREFPNYFLPPQYRGRRSSEVPPDVVARSRQQLEAAMASVFRRLMVPLVLPGSKEPSFVRYFDYLDKELKKIDPKVRVLPSGGVVRSTIGYIYAQLHEAMARDPKASPEQLLLAIAKDTKDLPGIHVRGVGSDFDVLLTHSGEHFFDLQRKALEITNSAETEFQMRNLAGGLKRSLFTVGDVKDYDSQTRRSTAQGGATIDFLAFDLETGKAVEPVTHRDIVDKLICGVYEYAPSATGTVEDSAKQTIRGIRPLLELPFLRMENDAQLRKELAKLREGTEKLPEKALEQFDKAVRNARMSGARNRFHRGDSGTIEADIAASLANVEERAQRSTIPEFVDAFPLENRKKLGDGTHDLPPGLLLDPAVFIAKYTADGVLYHGTASTENGLAIMRGGLFVSKPEGAFIGGTGRTTAVYGRGAYSSPQKATALAYSGAGGVVFQLPVRTDRPIHAIHWKSVQGHPFMVALADRAKTEGRDVFEILAREYGIDFIVHEHVLIQNVEAVQLPKSMGTLVRAYGTVVENPKASPEARIGAFENYRHLYRYAHALGDTDVPPPRDTKELMRLFLEQSEKPMQAAALLLASPSLMAASREALKDPAVEARYLEAVKANLSNPDRAEFSAAAKQVTAYLDAGKATHAPLFRSMYERVEEIARTTKASPLTVLQKECGFSINPIVAEDVGSAGEAPAKLADLVQWLDRVRTDRKASPRARTEAHYNFEQLEKTARAVSAGPWPFVARTELDILRAILTEKAPTVETFRALFAGPSGPTLSDLVRTTPEFRTYLRTAIGAGLKSRDAGVVRVAIDYLHAKLPNETVEDGRVHRAGFEAAFRIGEMGRFGEETHRVFSDRDVLEKVLFSEDADYVKYRPFVLDQLRKPAWKGIDDAIIAVGLRDPAALFRHGADVKGLFEAKLRAMKVPYEVKWPERNPFTDATFLADLRRYDEPLWRNRLEAAFSSSSMGEVPFDVSDPVQAEILRKVLVETKGIEHQVHDDWYERVRAKYPSKVAALRDHSNDPWRELALSLPDARLRNEYFANVDRARRARSAAHVAWWTAEKHPEEFFRAFVAPPTSLVISESSINTLLRNEKMRQKTIDRLRSAPADDHFVWELLVQAQLSAGNDIVQILRPAIEADAAWMARIEVQAAKARHGDTVFRQMFGKYLPDDRVTEDGISETLIDGFASGRGHAGRGDATRASVDTLLRLPLAGPSVEGIFLKMVERYARHGNAPEAGMVELIARLKEFRPGDSALSMLRIVTNPKLTYDALDVALPRSDPFWGKLQELALVQLPKEKSLEGLGEFDWDMTDPRVHRMLARLREKFPPLAQSKDPRVVVLRKNHSHQRFYDANPDSFATAEREAVLLARGLERSHYSVRRALIDWVRADPESYVRETGDTELLKELVSEGYASGGSTARLSQAAARWRGAEKLDPADRALLDFLVRTHGRTDVLKVVLREDGPARRWALGYLKEQPLNRTNILLGLLGSGGYLRGDVSETTTIIREALAKDAAWADRLMRQLPKAVGKDADAWAYLQFLPWDATKEAHREALDLLHAAGKGSTEYNIKEFFQHLATSQVPGYTEYIAANPQWGGDEDLRIVDALFDSLGKRGEEKKPLVESALDTRQSAALRAWLARPLVNETYRHESLFEAFRYPLEKLVARLRNLGPDDRLDVVFRLLASVMKHDPAAEAFLRKDTKLWDMLRARARKELSSLRQKPEENFWETPIRNYPWNLADPADLELFRVLHAEYGPEIAGQWEAQRLEAKRQERLAEREGREFVRRRDHRLEFAHTVRESLDEARNRYAIEHPTAFRTAFPGERFPAMTLVGRGHGNDHKALETAVRPSLYRSLVTKIQSQLPLTPSEQTLRAALLAQRDATFLNILLTHESDNREVLLAEIRRWPPLEVLEFLATKFPQFLEGKWHVAEAMKDNDRWKTELLRFAGDPSVPAQAWVDFPWNRGVAPAESTARDRLVRLWNPNAEERLRKMRRRLERTHGIPFLPYEDLADIDLEELPLEERAEYGRLLNSYQLRGMSQHADLEKRAAERRCAQRLGGLRDGDLWPLPKQR